MKIQKVKKYKSVTNGVKCAVQPVALLHELASAGDVTAVSQALFIDLNDYKLRAYIQRVGVVGEEQLTLDGNTFWFDRTNDYVYVKALNLPAGTNSVRIEVEDMLGDVRAVQFLLEVPANIPYWIGDGGIPYLETFPLERYPKMDTDGNFAFYYNNLGGVVPYVPVVWLPTDDLNACTEVLTAKVGMSYKTATDVTGRVAFDIDTRGGYGFVDNKAVSEVMYVANTYTIKAAAETQAAKSAAKTVK